jgi:hypothetical protein
MKLCSDAKAAAPSHTLYLLPWVLAILTCEHRNTSVSHEASRVTLKHCIWCRRKPSLICLLRLAKPWHVFKCRFPSPPYQKAKIEVQ